MTEKRITPKDGLDELEYGLLLELRLLKEVGAIAPVLEVMTACMAELYVESERREFERQEEERKRRAHSTPKGKDFQRSIGRTAFQKGYIPLQFKPDNLFIRRLIEEKTASGQWLTRLTRLDRERQREIYALLDRKIFGTVKHAAMNRFRRYVGPTM